MDLDKLKKIKLLLLDVDGVLTDGGIIYSDSGEQTKEFNSRDGLGIRLLMDNGIPVGIVTGRRSEALTHRCRNLGIDLLFDAVSDKAAVLKTISDRTGVDAAEMAFVGDDLVDLPLLKRVGVSIAVADAHESILGHVDVVTTACGGSGAVREICDAILKSQGLYDKAVKPFDL